MQFTNRKKLGQLFLISSRIVWIALLISRPWLTQLPMERTMLNSSHGLHNEVLVFKVLKVDLCARAILELVPLKDLVRSQRVSREWQGIVNQYLYSCRNFRFHYVLGNTASGNPHRNIEVSFETSLPQASKIITKLGPMLEEVNVTNRLYEMFETKKYLKFTKVIAIKCPNLQKINTYVEDERLLKNIKRLKHLKHISFYYIDLLTKNQDLVLGELLEGKDCESIFINANMNITGTFLRSANSNLKSLGFNECVFLKAPVMLTALDNLRNVTKLQVDDSRISFISEVHLLLKEMPQLEELSLRSYIPLNDEVVKPLSNESLDAFSGLVNLKRLDMENTHHVNDALLKALARGCKKLELLDIRGCVRRISAEGLRALCRRSPSAVTTLHFGLPYDKPDDYTLDVYFHNHFWRVPLFLELEQLNCVEMSLEWFRDAWMDPCGRELKLNTGPGGSIVRVDGPRQILKLVVFD